MMDKLIPSRPENACTGSVFAQNNLNNKIPEREQNILQECLNGNIPDFLRKFAPITINDGKNSITYLVTTDYLSIGTNEDYLRIPMNPLTAQKIADKYNCTLPTRKMVNDIWKQSVIKLQPLPWGPPYDSSMMSTDRYRIHNKRIQDQLKDKDITALISGQKKDVVLTNLFSPNNPKKRLALYGWIQLNGQPIQPMPGGHEDTYADYSHGIRLIANDVMVNGNATTIQQVFADSTLCSLVSDEGVLSFTRY